jgi:DNA-binding LacI/PurR family transcriptional regulator
MEEVAREAGVSRALVSLLMPFFAEMMDGIVEAADELDYRLLIGTGRREAAGDRRAVDAFFEPRADGLLLVSPRLPAHRDPYDRALRAHGGGGAAAPRCSRRLGHERRRRGGEARGPSSHRS